ncbi:MAG: asparagine--tRNA ligase [candidate division Zixibacteria bacterium]|nr:asparagine--tRNA ligase [candidate division Zixibacteria bacterium]
MKVHISELKDHVGQSVTVSGWLYQKRSSGKIKFAVLRDGTGYLQGVLAKGEAADSALDDFERLTQESSFSMTGPVREDKRAPGGFEMTVKELTVIQVAGEYPIGPKEHGPGFLMDNRHLWLRSSRQHAIMRVRNEIVMAIRQFFYERDFVLIDTPILTGAIGETASTLFETQYFDLGKAYLAQTGQLYVEAGAMAHGRVYCFGPTFRAEKSKTRKHLNEFWMLEPEVAFNDSNANMQLQEDLVCYIMDWVLRKCRTELAALSRDVSKLEAVKAPFPRISYDEAITRLQKAGMTISWGNDFGAPDEEKLMEEYERPLFVYNWPTECKAFYMKRNPERPDVVLCDDLLGPEGYGELIGGSQREDDHDLLLERIREQKLPEESYAWYLDLRKYGSVPHAGFGLGLERVVGWICGLEHVRETIPFARTIGRLYP